MACLENYKYYLQNVIGILRSNLPQPALTLIYKYFNHFYDKE